MVCVPLFVGTLLAHYFFFFFNDTATTEIYTLSLHDALPIFRVAKARAAQQFTDQVGCHPGDSLVALGDRKSTRLNSSHSQISYAVFCLKKKNDHRTSEFRGHREHTQADVSSLLWQHLSHAH